MAGTKVGSKIIETAKRVGSAAKSVVSRVANGARNVFNKVKSFFVGGELWCQPLSWMEIKINAVHSVNIGTTQQISISDHKTQSTEFGSLKLLQNVFA